MMNSVSVKEALAQLENVDDPFKTVFTHGTLLVEIYKPEGRDNQQPHARDEVYIIAEGNATFSHNGIEKEVKTGDFLFVPAGDEHRFVKFSDEFSTWVIFYGPDGGEAE